ncbi:aminoglycoside phosphotransferase family protein [Flavobacteriaceae bacterium]|nr:aminoglycoside phosphotransferase family protein [Flavobacteriaceae bacterium]
MKIKLFYILNGNNGATYILNTSSWKNIGISLKFYRAYTLKGKVQKSILTYFLFVVGMFFPSICKSKAAIELYLKENINADIDFILDSTSSVLISPNRDKVIVNHHAHYFHKFAFGKSFKKVKNESTIYKLLQNSKEFQVANVMDLKIDEQLSSCNFKLLNPPVKTGHKLLEINNLPEILVEFFNSSPHKKIVKFSDYIEDLLKRFHSLKMEPTNNLISYFKKIQEEHNTETMPLGLVHRDFKPWNTLLNSKLLIFDFEEAITDGPPLEDLLNYYIDPAVRYQSPLQVYDLIFSKDRIVAYKAYLILLDINLQFELFIVSYMMERTIFWTLADDPFTAKCYQNLLNHILLNSKR